MASARVEIRRIVCPTDLSECSVRALERAVRLAQWFDAQVTVLHVLPDAPYVIPADSGLPYLPTPADATRARREEAAGTLERFAAPFLARGAPIETRLVEGDPAREIEAAAEAVPADLVVMGTHGRSGLQHLLLGSVTESVLRRARCPVLTVGNVESQPHGGPPFRRILCAADLTDASGHTIDLALSLSEENEAELTLLHVVESLSDATSVGRLFHAVPEIGPLRRDVVGRARAQLRCAVPNAARDWCLVRERVAVGTAWNEILRVAQETGADLVVVGAHRRGPRGRMVFGSTSSHVVRQAACPVLVVREAAAWRPSTLAGPPAVAAQAKGARR
jgi:nucleotide-binding universal stress UspA family protein